MPDTAANSKIKILMIDDDPMLTKLYEMKAKTHQEIEFITASNTVEGEQLVLEKNPDVILIDLFLGQEPGASVSWVDKTPSFQFITKHKSDPIVNNIPVVVLSNLDTKEDHDKAIELGAAAYIVKVDNTPETIFETVKKLIQKT